MNRKKVSSSKLGRMAKFGTSLIKATGKYAITRAKEKSSEFLEKTPIKATISRIEASKELINSMGELKGGLMKIGQMLSITEGMILPPEITELFKELQKESPSMPNKDIDLMFKKNFDKLPEEIFKSFDRKPFAAASIGQVHKGETQSGEIVAIKIQYPNIKKAIKHDLENLDQFKRFFSIVFPETPNIEPFLMEMKEALLDECDYKRELEDLNYFRDIYEEEFPEFIIPKPYPKYSTNQILTMEYMSGDSFEESLDYSQEERNNLGKILFESYLYSLYKKGKIHSDPQHGNYLFKPGKVILLDFGSTRKFSKEFLLKYVKILLAIEECDFPSYKESSISLGLCLKSDSDTHIKNHMDLVNNLYGPYQKEGYYPIEDVNPFNIVGNFIKTISLENRSPREEFFLLDRATLGLFYKLKAWKSRINWVEGKDKYRADIVKELKEIIS